MQGAVGFIRIDSIECYIRLLGVPGYLDVDEFVYLMQVMDSEYVKHQQQKLKASMQAGKKK